MEWVLEAAEDVEAPPRWPLQVSTDPYWVTAALWCGNTLFEARVRGILTMVDKQRDSVKMTVTKALTVWLRTSLRDRGLPTFDPSFLDQPGTTLYVLSPSDGTVAPLAVTLMEQLIRRQRNKVAQWEEYPRIGMFLDELPNTPLPKILQYFAEARGLGVSICAAAQASSQLDVVYGGCRAGPSATWCPRQDRGNRSRFRSPNQGLGRILGARLSRSGHPRQSFGEPRVMSASRGRRCRCGRTRRMGRRLHAYWC
jgi:hypothetical protein